MKIRGGLYDRTAEGRKIEREESETYRRSLAGSGGEKIRRRSETFALKPVTIFKHQPVTKAPVKDSDLIRVRNQLRLPSLNFYQVQIK
jgi:hypothetical protein